MVRRRRRKGPIHIAVESKAQLKERDSQKASTAVTVGLLKRSLSSFFGTTFSSASPRKENNIFPAIVCWAMFLNSFHQRFFLLSTRHSELSFWFLASKKKANLLKSAKSAVCEDW